MEARTNARDTGKLLAHFLASKTSPLFGDHTFSLVGFSLGSQVCKSAINRLMKLGKEKLVHNMYFMAGCTYMKREKSQEQKGTFISCVSGQIYNMHTTNDKALVLFETIYGQRSIGRNPHFQQDRHNVSSTMSEADVITRSSGGSPEMWFKFENFDTTLIANGHMDYRVKMDLILEQINF